MPRKLKRRNTFTDQIDLVLAKNFTTDFGREQSILPIKTPTVEEIRKNSSGMKKSYQSSSSSSDSSSSSNTDDSGTYRLKFGAMKLTHKTNRDDIEIPEMSSAIK